MITSGSSNGFFLPEATSSKNPLHRVILGFNVKSDEQSDIKLILHEVIYKLIEDYEDWKEKKLKDLETEELKDVVRPCKVHSIRGCVFRQSGPAILGVSVLGGNLRTNTPLMRLDGINVGKIKSIQLEKDNIQEAKKGQEVAISIPGVTIGRQVCEEDILISDLSEMDFTKLKQLKKYLNGDEVKILREIAEIKRRENPVWGV